MGGAWFLMSKGWIKSYSPVRMPKGGFPSWEQLCPKARHLYSWASTSFLSWLFGRRRIRMWDGVGTLVFACPFHCHPWFFLNIPLYSILYDCSLSSFAYRSWLTQQYCLKRKVKCCLGGWGSEHPTGGGGASERPQPAWEFPAPCLIEALLCPQKPLVSWSLE